MEGYKPDSEPLPAEQSPEVPQKKKSSNFWQKIVAIGGATIIGGAALKGVKDLAEHQQQTYAAAFKSKVEAAGGQAAYDKQQDAIEQEKGMEQWKKQLEYYYSRLEGHPTNPYGGSDPMRVEMRARAIEIAMNKGLKVHFLHDDFGRANIIEGGLVTESLNHGPVYIPTSIRIGSQDVPLSREDYRPEELKAVQEYIAHGYRDPLAGK